MRDRGGDMPAINFIAVAVAGVAGWLIGAIWYGALGRQWMRALGKSEEECNGPRHMPVGPMMLAIVANVLMALMLGGMTGHIVPRPTIVAGIVAGALVWLGFVITTMAVNNAFA